jgi:hypothetical protein
MANYLRDDEDFGFMLISHEQSEDSGGTLQKRKARVEETLELLQPKLPQKKAKKAKKAKKKAKKNPVAGSKKEDRTMVKACSSA